MDQKVTVLDFEDLKRVLRQAAGSVEGIELDDESLDADFEALGYDSLALLETAAQISREYRIALDDDIITAARTPRELLKVINAGA